MNLTPDRRGSEVLHTQGPWYVLDGRRISVGLPSLTPDCGFDSHCIALTHDSGGRLNAEANAARIVQCVNAHDELVEALQAAKAEADYQRAGHIEMRRIDRERLDHLARLFEGALAKAGGAA